MSYPNSGLEFMHYFWRKAAGLNGAPRAKAAGTTVRTNGCHVKRNTREEGSGMRTRSQIAF